MKHFILSIHIVFFSLFLYGCTINSEKNVREEVSSQSISEPIKENQDEKEYYETSIQERAPFVKTSLDGITFSETKKYGLDKYISEYKLIRSIGRAKSEHLHDIIAGIGGNAEEKKDCNILEIATFLPWKNPKNFVYYELSTEAILKAPEKWESGYQCGPIKVGPSAGSQYLVYSPKSHKIIYIDLWQDAYIFNPATLDF